MSLEKIVLVTGCAGFIGFHLALRLLGEGRRVVGIDNVNEYYDVNLKWNRLKQLQDFPKFEFHQLHIQDRRQIETLFARYEFDVVVHLAAQAGVRYSLINPYAYMESNLAGFISILEGCRQQPVRHLVFASSSSVYGANTGMPFSVHQNVDHPVSLYAATKKANELMAHSYAHLYRLPCTGLRFFTVYGPWGRPDMAAFLFTRAILAREPIHVFNYGAMKRDFTYIDDIVEGIRRVMAVAPIPNPEWTGDAPDPGTSSAPYRIYNIGNNQPVSLMDFIQTLENCLGVEAIKEMAAMQPGDVPETYADIADLTRDFGFSPQTPIAVGLARFVEWYRLYYLESSG
jgi:UDP-glucuronate 4-epimerase